MAWLGAFLPVGGDVAQFFVVEGVGEGREEGSAVGAAAVAVAGAPAAGEVLVGEEMGEPAEVLGAAQLVAVGREVVDQADEGAATPVA